MLYTGGPAFPDQYKDGMSIRDYFAAKAMQGLVSDPDLVLDAIQTAQLSYKYADAMLQVRDKQ